MDMNKDMAQKKLLEAIVRHTVAARHHLALAAMAAEVAGLFGVQLSIYGAMNQLAAAVPSKEDR